MNTPTRIERLETRIAPAGVVLADYNPATGALELLGDGDENSLSMFRTGPSTFRIEGFDNTLIGGAEFLDTAKITSLTVDLGAGNDELFLTNLTLSLAEIDLGAGVDFLQSYNVIVRGNTNLNYGDDGGDAVFGGPVTTLGGLFITSASGDSQTSFGAAATQIKGVLSLQGSAGFDSLSCIGNLSIGKGLVVNGNGGDDQIDFGGAGTLLIGKSPTGQSIEFTGGAGEDRITLGTTGVNLAGYIDFDAGDGSNSLTVGGSQSTVKMGTASSGASIFYTGGTGADLVEVDAFSAILAGGIDVDGGALGENVIDIDWDGNLRIGKIKSSGDSIALLGGADADSIFLGGNLVTLAGGIFLEAGDGANTLDVDGANVTIGKSVDGRALTFAGANGTDSLDLQGGRMTLKGQLFFGASGGADEADLTELNFFTAPGVVFEGGDDNDSFELQTHVLNIGGSVELLGGNGNDNLRFFGDGTVKGSLTLDVEGGNDTQLIAIGDRSGFVGSLRVLGDLTIASIGDLLSFDDVSVENVSVGKSTAIDVGNGDSFVTLDNVFARGAVSLQTQGGNDTLLIERFSFFNPSIFSKPVTIALGAGADTLRIGDSTVEAIALHNRARFLAAVTINGGDGSDTLNDDLETANDFAVDPIVIGFE